MLRRHRTLLASMRRRLQSCLDTFETVSDGHVLVLRATTDEEDPLYREASLLKYAPEQGLPVLIRQSPKGADGLGGVVWPGAIALAALPVARYDPQKRESSSSAAGRGFSGWLLERRGAGHVTLTDEFVELACANASLTEDGDRCPIIVRRSGGATLTTARTIHLQQRSTCGTRRAEGYLTSRMNSNGEKSGRNSSIRVPGDRVRRGGGVDADGRRSFCTCEGDQTTAGARIVTLVAEPERPRLSPWRTLTKCATSSFLNLAKKELKIVHIKKDVPNVKEGEIDGSA